MAVVRDLTIDAGSTVRWSIVWRQLPQQPGAVGVPYDLTGASAGMHIRTRPNLRGVPLLELDNTGADGSSGVYLGGPNGLIVINIVARDSEDLAITAADGRDLRVRRAFYDLFVTLANGETHKVMQGKLKIIPNVTDYMTLLQRGDSA